LVLGWRAGQFRGALFRARALLEKRLRRRGIAAGVVIAALAESLVVQVPSVLEAATAAAAADCAAHKPLDNEWLTELIDGVLNDMIAIKLKTVLAAVILAVFTTGFVAYLTMTPVAAVPLPASLKDQREVIFVAAAREGIVTRVPVKPGQVVQEGDLLAELDNRLALATLESAKARLAAARAQQEASYKTRDEAKNRSDRSRELFRRACIALDQLRLDELTFDRTVADAGVAEQNVKLAEQEIRQAEVILSMHRVCSPAAGTIKAIIKRPGEGVKALDGVLELLIQP
jgi:multidrug efflux pump subunit AcrA (membrane-fusion protein)